MLKVRNSLIEIRDVRRVRKLLTYMNISCQKYLHHPGMPPNSIILTMFICPDPLLFNRSNKNTDIWILHPNHDKLYNSFQTTKFALPLLVCDAFSAILYIPEGGPIHASIVNPYISFLCFNIFPKVNIGHKIISSYT